MASLFRALGMSPLEAASAGLSLLAVWATARRWMWCWPVGLVSVLLYAGVFVDAHLFSDALLQLVYAGMLAYGWWNWSRARRQAQDGSRIPRTRPATAALLGWSTAAGVTLGMSLGAFMSLVTQAEFAWLDALLASFSLVAQFWAARLVRANWLLWIALDVVYVAMYLAKDLRVTAALYGLFVVLAIRGWFAWGVARAPTPDPVRDSARRGPPGN